MTPGLLARAMALSISPLGVTHTGQPGPERSLTWGGKSPRRPWRKMATVWVPHTSIRLTGGPDHLFILSARAPARAGWRNSVRNLTPPPPPPPPPPPRAPRAPLPRPRPPAGGGSPGGGGERRATPHL